MVNDNTPSRLGRGLGSMVSEVSTIKAGGAPTGGGFTRIPLGDIHQSLPGRTPDHTLRESVKQFGVLQPVLVGRSETGFTLLAGSRRLQASRDAGLADIPAIIVPPDRAGSLDVFLEENLSRQDLTEHERVQLRGRWMRETGRDEDQARTRIPEPVARITESLVPDDRHAGMRAWQIASAALGLICIALLLILLIRPSGDTVVVTDEMPIEAAPPVEVVAAPDTSWMESFKFPGNARIVDGERLTLLFAKRIFNEQGEITPAARVFLYQLAAVIQSSGKDLNVEITGFGADAKDPAEQFALGLRRASAAAQHLRGEGIPEASITLLSSSTLPDTVGYEQTVQIVLSPK